MRPSSNVTPSQGRGGDGRPGEVGHVPAAPAEETAGRSNRISRGPGVEGAPSDRRRAALQLARTIQLTAHLQLIQGELTPQSTSEERPGNAAGGKESGPRRRSLGGGGVAQRGCVGAAAEAKGRSARASWPIGRPQRPLPASTAAALNGRRDGDGRGAHSRRRWGASDLRGGGREESGCEAAGMAGEVYEGVACGVSWCSTSQHKCA